MNIPKSIKVTIDRATSYEPIPQDIQIHRWAMTVLIAHCKSAVLDIRLVDPEESASLNKRYRHKEHATNILSFEFEPPPNMQSNILGDIVLCPAKIAEEITVQPPTKEALEAHWAHLIIHGCLHLLGYHHSTDNTAHEMEQLEIESLTILGYPNPYEQSV